MFKKIKSFLKSFFVGVIAFVLPFLEQFSWVFSFLRVDKLMIIYYILASILLLSAILELNQTRQIKKKGLQPKATETTILAITPEEKAKEVIKSFNALRKVGKNMVKFLKTYKGIIVSALIFIVTIIDEFTGMFGNVLVVNGTNILQVIGYGASTIIAALSYGLGSPQFKEAIAKLKTSLKEEEANNPSNDPKKVVKYVESLIKTNEKEVATLKSDYEKDKKALDSEYTKVISDYQMSNSLGIITTELENQYNEYLSKLSNLKLEYEKQINSKEQIVETYKAKLEELNAKQV